MAEFNHNVWAPWRLEYLRALGAGEGQCFLCEYAEHPEQDADHHVVCRADGALLVMNRYPYTNGHMLVAPPRHIGELEELTDAELSAGTRLVRDGLRILKSAVQAQGYNVGMNLGRCAGAGLPGHLHWHIVPRWSGDTNFMSTVADIRVVPEALGDLYQRMRSIAAELGLR